MSAATDLQELIDSGLHLEYPDVLLQDAVHTFVVVSYLDAKVLKCAFPCRHLDPYQTALAVLSEHLSAFQNLITRLASIQSHYEVIRKVIREYLPSEKKNFEIATVASLFTPDVVEALKPFLYSYMLLVLIAAEDSSARHNCFSGSIVTSSIKSGLPIGLLDRCCEIFSHVDDFSFRFLLEDLAEPFIKAAFQHKIEELITDDYSTSFVKPLVAYMERIVNCEWFSKINHVDEGSSFRTARLVYDAFYRVRKPELFRIMMDYPDSRPAILDLKQYLLETNSLQSLIDTLTKEVRDLSLLNTLHLKNFPSLALNV